MTALRPNPLLLATLGTVALLAVASIALRWQNPAKDFPAPVQAAALAGSASRTPVLVELFTSEGCSSCPPADALLAELDQKQFVPGAQAIVLSEHVSYWNNLGWRDPFSSQAFTDRQNDYASRLGIEGPYTPQAVVDGHADVVGSNRANLARAVQSASIQPKIPLSIENAHWAGDKVQATLRAAPFQNATLIAALADDQDQSSVLRGENEGRNLSHVAVVRTLMQLRPAPGSTDPTPIELKLLSGVPQPKMRLVVFLADKRTGHILGAAMQLVTR